MNLVVDVGNSLVKMAVFQEDKLLKKLVLVKTDFKNKFEEIKNSYPNIYHVLVSNVSKTELSGIKKIKETHQVVFLSPELNLPFENLYATPQTLGNDRIALMAAASHFFKSKNVLVVDAGTCLTFDFLNSKNQYLGGAISPGLKMRYEALHNYTSKLPLLEPSEDVQLIGNTTKSSMDSGVVNGICKEIEGVISEYLIQYQDLTIILTGGDAQFLSKSLKSSIFANPNFLLEGLNCILEINKSK